MLKGTPYWGTTTFEDKRTILKDLQSGKINRELPDDLRECSSLYALFYAMGKNKYAFIIENNYFSWCKDIKMDYRDKVIFVPYYEYDTVNVSTTKRHKHLDTMGDTLALTYNYQLKIMPVKLDSLKFTIVSTTNLQIYEIDVTNLPMLDFQPSIKELYELYKNASFYDEAWGLIDFENNYHWIGAEKGLNEEARIRASKGYPAWKLGKAKQCTQDVKDLINCGDIRLYNLQLLQTYFKFDLNLSNQYWERAYLFSAYLLFTSLSELDFVEKDFNVLWRDLGTMREVIKYDEDDFPLYLKHYYKKVDYFAAKSYEHYIEDLW